MKVVMGIIRGSDRRMLTAVSATAARPKPLLRGVSHQVACGVALVAGVLLVRSAPTPRGRLAAALYATSLVVLFGVSALYHRPTWAPAARARFRRLDHSAIFVLIAGSYLPFGMLLPPAAEHALLGIVGCGAALGIVQSLAWVHAPKPLVALSYVVLGWAAVPFLPALRQVVDARQIALLVAAGVCYSAGAVVYATRRPDPAPRVFGYHEIFHALTIVAASCHFASVVGVVQRIS